MNDKRLQQVAEQILTDSSLTDDMNDAEATRLIDWAVNVAKGLALQTANMDDVTAEDYLYPPMKSLRKTVKRFNKLFANMQDMDDEAFQQSIGDIYATAKDVYVLDAPEGRGLFDFAQFKNLTPVEQVSELLAKLNLPTEDAVQPLRDPGPKETQPIEPFSAEDVEALEGYGFDLSNLPSEEVDQPPLKDE